MCDIKCFQYSSATLAVGAKFSLGMHFWEVLTLLFDSIEPFVWTDGRSAEGGSWQSLFMVWQWTSWAPGDGANQFDFHQDVNSNYNCGVKPGPE